MTANLTLGIIKTSTKEDERRVPIHPDHFSSIPDELRDRIYIEEGYGQSFFIDDSVLEKNFAGVLSKKELFEKCDIILIPKPTEKDFGLFKDGQTIWGWVHCVQNEPITQIAIDKKMTYIAWESMHDWKDGKYQRHSFYQNNELAGYSAVLHACQLKGITGHYGKKRKVAVFGSGFVAKGAMKCLKSIGFSNITVFSELDNINIDAEVVKFRREKKDKYDIALVDDKKISEKLADYDIIINGIFQDTDNPLMFVSNDEISNLKKGSLIVDISCDLGMGFEFAKPTDFKNPIFVVSNRFTYYAVDHTPSYLWDATSYTLSNAIIPLLNNVMNKENNETISRATEIENGIVKNSKILSFQKRELEYPHRK